MAKNFKELEAKMSPERRARVGARTQELIEQMVAQEGIKDLCGIKVCESCERDVDPHGDNCATLVLADDEEVFAHKVCPRG